MKKYLFLIIALCCAVVTKAQGTDQFSAILQHGDEASFYKGSTAFQQAYAAAVDGDVIILSQGVFEPVSLIEKSLKIYGAGFEDNTEANTAVTEFSGAVNVGKTDDVLDGFHMEGIKTTYSATFRYEMKNATIQKCDVGGDVTFNKNIENVVVKQCRIRGSVKGAQAVIAKGLLVANCYLNGNVNTFSRESFINVDHCCYNLYDSRDGYSRALVTNCIIRGRSNYYVAVAGPYSTIRNCIANNEIGYPSSQAYNLYQVDINTIFADAENTDYSETRTFELKDPETYKGTDGTPIGPSGGEGWDKVPAKPSIKNLNTTVSGINLNVTYTPVVK